MRRLSDPSVGDTTEGDGAECPYCGSEDTVMEHPKGPALCRSIHYCNNCSQPFERMK